MVVQTSKVSPPPKRPTAFASFSLDKLTGKQQRLQKGKKMNQNNSPTVQRQSAESVKKWDENLNSTKKYHNSIPILWVVQVWRCSVCSPQVSVEVPKPKAKKKKKVCPSFGYFFDCISIWGIEYLRVPLKEEKIEWSINLFYEIVYYFFWTRLIKNSPQYSANKSETLVRP